MNVHHCLDCTGTHHAGKRPAGKSQDIFGGSGCKQNLFGFNKHIFAVVDNADSFIAEYAPDDCFKPDIGAAFFNLIEQVLSDIDSSCSRLMSSRAEKFVDLLKELSACLLVLIANNNLARLPSLPR